MSILERPRLAEMTTEALQALLTTAPAPSLVIKQGTTVPPVQSYVTDNNGPYDTTSLTTVLFAMKGVTTGPLVTGTGAKQQVSFTANTTITTNQLTTVSSTTGLFGPELDGSRPGSILIGPGIPAPVYNSLTQTWACTTITAISGSTITMSANATATATGATFTGNQGLIQYTLIAGNTSVVDTYFVEWKLTTSTGGVIFVPSDDTLNQTLRVAATLGE